MHILPPRTYVAAATGERPWPRADQLDPGMAAEAVAQQQRELAAAREFWTNTVVHDLKGPLSAINGYVEMLQCGLLGELSAPQQAALRDMRRASDALAALVADINDSFRLEAGGMALQAVPTAVEDLLREAVASTYADPSGRPAEMVAPTDHLLPVLADSRLILRVLRNLVGNAHKHAGPAARVVLSATGAVGGWVHLAVEDDGPGIPAAARERVFDRFYQAEGHASGSGLGLAFCKLVVERHGGRIWAEEATIRGARVCFSLPVAPSTRGANGTTSQHGHLEPPAQAEPGVLTPV